MTVEAVAQALEAMADDEVRERLAAGDDAEISGFELTGDERDMVIAAAADYPEVEGFQFRRKSAHQITVGQPAPNFRSNLSPFSVATFYVGNNANLNHVIIEPH